MSFTYDPQLLDDISIVRFNIGDTSPDGQYIQDETIKYYLRNYSVNVAVVRCIQYIITQLSTPTFKLDWLQVSNKEALESFRLLLKEKAGEFGVPLSGLVASSSIGLPFRADSYVEDVDDLSSP